MKLTGSLPAKKKKKKKKKLTSPAIYIFQGSNPGPRGKKKELMEDLTCSVFVIIFFGAGQWESSCEL